MVPSGRTRRASACPGFNESTISWSDKRRILSSLGLLSISSECNGCRRPKSTHHLFLFCIPEHGPLLPIRFHRKFDSDHRGGTQFRVTVEPAVAAEHVEEIAFHVAVRLQLQSCLRFAVVLRQEFRLEIAIEP